MNATTAAFSQPETAVPSGRASSASPSKVSVSIVAKIKHKRLNAYSQQQQQQQQQDKKDPTANLPPALSDLVSSFEALKSRGKFVGTCRCTDFMWLLTPAFQQNIAVGKSDQDYNSKMLDASFMLVPDIFECER